MIEPVPYRKHNGFIGSFSIQMSPDGWRNSITKHLDDEARKNYCLEEYIKVIKELMKAMPDLATMQKFFRKHGKQIRCEGYDPTLAFTVEREMYDYTVEATGPNMEVYAHRKE